MTEIFKGKLLTDSGKIKKEAAKRKSDFNFISVSKSETASYEAQGFEHVKELKTKWKLRKFKDHSEIFENRCWLLMYLLGYPELNEGRDFKVLISRPNSSPLYKQIDIFAKDEETVIVAECKSCASPKKRSLQKDIEEFASLKGPIAQSIKQHYGKDFKPKILWMFFTENVIWTKEDKQRAAGNNIHVVTERELRYYLQIGDHLRKAARYQFLAEHLKGQKIPELANRKVPAIKGKLGGETYYTFATTPADLIKIAFVNHRSLNDPEGAPSYQRLVSRSRIREIANFIKGGGYFPNNILVNFTENVRFETKEKDETAKISFGSLYLPDKYRSVWVIDGQHRLYGYAPLEKKFSNQNIIVVAFEKLDKTDEANLFVTINHEQKTVPKTLLDDLEGELKWGSKVPSERIGAISARLVTLLNNDLGEPFYNRVTRQGIPATEKTCLTVPAIKEGLRRSGLIGTIVLKSEFSPGPLSGLTDTETLDRARSVLNQFFQMVKLHNPAQWEYGRKGYTCTNTALQAYLLLLAQLLEYMETNKGMTARELSPQELVAEIEEYLDPVLRTISSLSDQQMEERFKVQYGSGGPLEYYYRLCKIVQAQYSDFQPEGYEKWEQERSLERIEEADRKLKDINIIVQKHIFSVFKALYGSKESEYWEKGIMDKNIKFEAYKKSLDHEIEDRLPLENYLDFIQYKKVVEAREHWPYFKPAFDIPEAGDKGRAKNISWMEKINELRRIPAHATADRTYKLEDFDYINFIHELLVKNLANEDYTQYKLHD